MVKTLLVVIRSVRTSALEFAGAAAIVAGTAQFSHGAAWIVGGVAALAKSMEWDLARREGPPQ